MLTNSWSCMSSVQRLKAQMSSISRALNFSMSHKMISYNVWEGFFVWNLKGTLWNSTQNTLSIRRKRCLIKSLKWKPVDLRTHVHFLNGSSSYFPVDGWSNIWTTETFSNTNIFSKIPPQNIPCNTVWSISCGCHTQPIYSIVLW